MIQIFTCLVDVVVQKVYQYCKRFDKILVISHLRHNFRYNRERAVLFHRSVVLADRAAAVASMSCSLFDIELNSKVVRQ